MLTLIALAAPAMADIDDCIGLDAAVCEWTNDAAFLANTERASTVLSSTAPGRLNTNSVYARLLALKTSLDASSCTVSEVTGGAYGGGSWSGFVQGGAFPAPTSGVYSSLAILGTYAGSPNGDVGNLWGQYAGGGRFVTNRNDEQGFYAGYWIRETGTTGVFVGVFGSCAGDSRDLSTWLGKELDYKTFEDVHPVLAKACARCHTESDPTRPVHVEPYIGDPDFGVASAAAAADCFGGPPTITCGELAVDLILTDNKPIKPSGAPVPMSDQKKALFEQWQNGGLLIP
ncbi:MAG: hypothetical protein H6734_17185 [Alphaproteobacteria bacterium]|nr:hypothetical protein [Alphaproteobacteria bacterium]